MKPSLLLITKHSFDCSSIIEEYYCRYKIIWLQLWPVLNKSKIISDYPEITVFCSLDFISTHDHERIARDAYNISTNWWELLGFNRIGKERKIDNLSITKIFSSEYQLLTSRLFYYITIINNAIKKVNPSKIIFIEPESSTSMSSEPLERMKNFNISDLYVNENPDNGFVRTIKVEDNYRLKVKYLFKQRVSNIIKKALTHSPLGLLRLHFWKRSRLDDKSIIISNSKRCMENFIINAPFPRNIYILDNSGYHLNEIETLGNPIYELEDFIYDKTNLTYFFKILTILIINKFNSLNNYYHQVCAFARKVRPAMYITVDISSPVELIKLWAMRKSEVRAVLSSEGLGTPDGTLALILDNHLHPDLDIERWVFGNHIKDKYYKGNTKVKVTGFFGNSINSPLINLKLFRKKRVVLALSDPIVHTSMAMLREDVFEIVSLIKDVIDCIQANEGYELVIKIHPGDVNNIALYKTLFADKYEFVKFTQKPINYLLQTSELVILYSSSVLVDALIKNVNVIFYNYLKRTSYSNAVYKYLNHNAKIGAAVREAKSKDELKMVIFELLNNNTRKNSPGLEYVVKNVNNNFNIKDQVLTLI